MQGLSGQALLLDTLERLLDIPSADLKTALSLACDAVAEAMHADKVDAFIFDPARSSLVAIGASNQPLSRLQRQLGLDVLPIANGGRAAQVFTTKAVFRTGHLTGDPDELKGIREGLKVESQIAVPVEVGGEIRGVLAVCSLQRDLFSHDDERFVMSIAHWVGSVAHRAELVAEIARNAVEQGRRAVAEELVTVLAHDLRNFVAPLTGRVERIHHRAAKDGRDADVRDADGALKAVRRVTRLIEDILDVARLDQGVFRLDPQPINLGAVAADVARTLSTPAHEVRAAIADEVVVRADLSRVSQCLENLVSNAVRHSPRGSPVFVEVSKERLDEGEVGVVCVVDEGPGVPVEILPRIFERFSVGEGSSGLGLGLYLARRIAVAHGGDLSVDSAPGQGARFRLRLPARGEE